jgi:hypothetical protein
MPHYMFFPREKTISRTFKISGTLIVKLYLVPVPILILIADLVVPDLAGAAAQEEKAPAHDFDPVGNGVLHHLQDLLHFLDLVEIFVAEGDHDEAVLGGQHARHATGGDGHAGGEHKARRRQDGTQQAHLIPFKIIS